MPFRKGRRGPREPTSPRAAESPPCARRPQPGPGRPPRRAPRPHCSRVPRVRPARRPCRRRTCPRRCAARAVGDWASRATWNRAPGARRPSSRGCRSRFARGPAAWGLLGAAAAPRGSPAARSGCRLSLGEGRLGGGRAGVEGGCVCKSCRRPFLPSDSWSLRFFFGKMDRNRDDCVGTGGTVHRKAHRREVRWARPGKGPSGQTFPRPAPCRERRTWPTCRRLGCSLGPSPLRAVVAHRACQEAPMLLGPPAPKGGLGCIWLHFSGQGDGGS